MRNMKRINTEKRTTINTVFKVLRELSNFADALIIPIIFLFFLCREKADDNKEFSFSCEIQNFVLNHESGPVKSNPVYIYIYNFFEAVIIMCDYSIFIYIYETTGRKSGVVL